MKNQFAAIVILAATTPLSFGVLYTLNSGLSYPATGIVTQEGWTFRNNTTAGTAFSEGGGVSAGPGIVAFGIFSTDELANLSAPQLIASFTAFGNPGPFTAAGPLGNRSVYSLAEQIVVTGSVFDMKSMYLFAGNGTTFETSSQFLVVKSAFVFDPAMDPVPTPLVNTVTTLNSVVLIGSVVPDVQTINADTTVTPGWRMASGSGWQTLTVPEASTALLSALGALGLVSRRKR